MNKLTKEKQRQMVAALVEGNSIRATCRMTGIAKNTVIKLLVDLGKACSEYQDKTLHNLTCKKFRIPRHSATDSGIYPATRSTTFGHPLLKAAQSQRNL